MTQLSPEVVLKAHKVLADFAYECRPVEHGYANRTLYINLDNSFVQSKPVAQKMKDLFTGGRGFAMWLLWNAVADGTAWDDPSNELIITGGPIGGITAYPGSGKATVVTISPLTHAIIDSNGGGYFGPYLKFAGWDALEIQGKADKDVIIFIDGDNGRVTVEEAPLEPVDTHLVNRMITEIYGKNDRERRGISVVSAGQAAEHIPMCGLNISYWDARRQEVRIKQAARGGAGSVLRDKKIKAIVVRFTDMGGDANGCAKPELVRKAGARINSELTRFDASQNDMRGTGTPYLVEIMNRFDLLPCKNFRFGADPDALKVAGEVWKAMYDRRGPDGCWYGCTMACAHGVPGVKLRTGPYQGECVFVDGPEYETLGALSSNLSIFDPQNLLELNFYCDTYGIDTISVGDSIAFAMECYEIGILNPEMTGGMELTWGNADVALELLHQMARGEGFGLIVGQGVRFMKKYFVEKYGADPALMQDIGMEIKGMEISEYMSKESLAQQGGYALASKGAQHDEAWLTFMELVHKQIPTFETKAEALHYFPMWRTWFSLHGLCKLPWNDITPESNKTAREPGKVPEHVENYTWLYEGVTGKPTNIDEIILASERVYNLQRLFNLRLGYGTRQWDYPPYRLMGPATVAEYESRAERYDGQLKEVVGYDPTGRTTEEKMAALREYKEKQYDLLIDAVYQRRGWSKNGIPTLDTVRRLGIDFPDVVALIAKNY
ncbi:aldehyde:ferredoxin oxidoreductase [Longilinea arvoryzae]|uniref:Aldehyde:ferredoxin oxidoreductase n=1 Tax=Longilinea arvoryzae TaxID=360412 RepID=A0A0S7BKS4_9CHLR|nr:aldehyde ferredoxin oxidoreductase C-terminal domain-containing protein [Longilinea arvoryzae]GAP14555.1 aldehyde:ferredoxin oxidoreductase [Longilinea arvoryzae]